MREVSRITDCWQPMNIIESTYDGKWVFMVDCSENDNGTLLGGHVVVSGESRANVFRKIKEVNDGTSLTFFGYVGKIPEEAAYL
ncbi:MAG: hypothetical protein FWB80_11010 [Defluviitaleaceae bacterium]|nr:hypothetical protein [Defluviitaleaceae bacterium]